MQTPRLCLLRRCDEWQLKRHRSALRLFLSRAATGPALGQLNLDTSSILEVCRQCSQRCTMSGSFLDGGRSKAGQSIGTICPSFYLADKMVSNPSNRSIGATQVHVKRSICVRVRPWTKSRVACVAISLLDNNASCVLNSIAEDVDPSFRDGLFVQIICQP